MTLKSMSSQSGFRRRQGGNAAVGAAGLFPGLLRLVCVVDRHINLEECAEMHAGCGDIPFWQNRKELLNDFRGPHAMQFIPRMLALDRGAKMIT
jgi:hypothetical protein